MAMFFAQRIVLGKISFKEIPEVLKKEVAKILNDNGLIDLTL